MKQSTPHKRKQPKRILALSDLEHTKTVVLNSLRSASGQRTYDHAIREFVAWYCSEPRLAFNRTVVLRYRLHLEQRDYAPATINLRLAAIRRVAYEASDAGLLSAEAAAACIARPSLTHARGHGVDARRSVAWRRGPRYARPWRPNWRSSGRPSKSPAGSDTRILTIRRCTCRTRRFISVSLCRVAAC